MSGRVLREKWEHHFESCIYQSWILVLSQMGFLHNCQDAFSGTFCCWSVGGIKPPENGSGNAISAVWGFDGIINITCEVNQSAIDESTKKKKNHRAFPSCPHNASLSESTLSSWNLVSILTWWGFSGILELRLDLEKTCSDTSWLCLWLCKWTDLTHGWVCTASWRPKCYGKFRALLPNPVLYADGNKISKSWFVGHDSIFSKTTETQKGRNHQRTKENSGLSSTNSRVKWSMYVCEGWGRIETGRER